MAKKKVTVKITPKSGGLGSGAKYGPGVHRTPRSSSRSPIARSRSRYPGR